MIPWLLIAAGAGAASAYWLLWFGRNVRYQPTVRRRVLQRRNGCAPSPFIATPSLAEMRRQKRALKFVNRGK